MDRAELRQLVWTWVDDLQGGYFTESQVNTFLNNAQREVQKQLIQAWQNYYTICAQTTLVVNQTDYVLPENFKKVDRLELITSGTPPNETLQQILPITLGQKALVYGYNVTPCAYFLKKNRIVLVPCPTTAYQMRMYYTYEVADMLIDSDVPDVPDAYHEYIALLATLDCFLKDARQPDLIVAKINIYKDMLKQDANERRVDLPRYIVDTGYNDVGSWY